jgi:succinate dehydrogenase / fumarate reductase flavoprotein subunit
MLDFSAFIVEGALSRNESRGAHFRNDFDTRDDENFLKHTFAYMDESGDIKIEYTDVALGKFEPEARTY